MRCAILSLLLMIQPLGLSKSDPPNSKISQMPDGTFVGNVYANETLGLSFEFPSGWIAHVPLKSDNSSAPGAAKKVDPKADQCTKVLLYLPAPGKVEGRFNSEATLFAIDSSCFQGAEFPQSVDEKKKILKIADKIIKPFSGSPYFAHYFSPYGVTISALNSQGRVTVLLTGGMIINAIEGPHPGTKEPLDVTTSFSIVRSGEYWIGLAYVADNASAEELKKAKFVFKDETPN